MSQHDETNVKTFNAYYGELRKKYNCHDSHIQTRAFVTDVQVLPFEDSLETFAKERARLWDEGKKIEDFDLLIGCAAKAAGLTIVTHNVKHFNHIEGLNIEDWINNVEPLKL